MKLLDSTFSSIKNRIQEETILLKNNIATSLKVGGSVAAVYAIPMIIQGVSPGTALLNSTIVGMGVAAATMSIIIDTPKDNSLDNSLKIITRILHSPIYGFFGAIATSAALDSFAQYYFG